MQKQLSLVVFVVEIDIMPRSFNTTRLCQQLQQQGESHRVQPREKEKGP